MRVTEPVRGRLNCQSIARDFAATALFLDAVCEDLALGDRVSDAGRHLAQPGFGNTSGGSDRKSGVRKGKRNEGY